MGLDKTILIATAATAITIVCTFVYKKWKQAKIPTTWEKVATVKKLHIYPLKSGHRIEVNKAEVTDVGLRQTADQNAFQLRDRALIVYGAKDNEFKTGRTYPKMVLIHVSIHDDDHVAIDAPAMRTLYVKIPNKKDNPTTSIKCWSNERIQGVDCGDEAASWFSRYLLEMESGLRLAYNDASQRRNITNTHLKTLGHYYKNLGNQSTGLFSDLTSVTLMSQNSVDDLNKRIGNSVVVIENFRQNIIVDDSDLEPYGEDSWEWIKIGDGVILRNVKDCTRCVFTTINPENGVRNKTREPLKTLETYRLSSGPKKLPKLGINLEVRKTGFISVGDPVYMVKKENGQ